MTKEELLSILADKEKADAELDKILKFYEEPENKEPENEEPKNEEPKGEVKSDTKITATFAEFMQLVNKMMEKEKPKNKEEDENNAEIFI